jgi:hypothetical protein
MLYELKVAYATINYIVQIKIEIMSETLERHVYFSLPNERGNF